MAAPLDNPLDTVLAWGRAPAEAGVARRWTTATATASAGAGYALAGQPLRERLATLVACIDLTTLEGSDTPGRVAALGARACRPDPDDPTLTPVAALCVYPSLVPAAVAATVGSPVMVASVAGAFPSGQSPLPVRLADITAAVAAGADEIDIVLNRGAFLDGDLTTAHADLVASIAAAGGRPVKVILETGELGSNEAVHRAALLSMAAGADMIKTSTGKIAVSATPDAVATMADAIAAFRDGSGREVGLKVSGGLRTVDDAVAYANLVAAALGAEWITPARFRLGASRLLDALVEARRSA